ncbi:MAG: FAD-dependent oxidoreductase, partial [Clostridia bacterium]|nr:FAD-dependent oxidoreductase [Clostridia bacterium]
MNYDVAIVGGGAAGLACAARLNKSGKQLKICVIEAGDRIGKKLAATGNGQGNVSNEEMTAEHYHGGNTALVEKLTCADPYAGTKLFSCLFCADNSGRIYPAGRQASALVDDFLRQLNSNISLLIGTKAEKIKKTENGFEIYTSGSQIVNCKYIVLCTGGKAQKQFKTDGSSYALATSLGHT